MKSIKTIAQIKDKMSTELSVTDNTNKWIVVLLWKWLYSITEWTEGARESYANLLRWIMDILIPCWTEATPASPVEVKLY